MTSTAESPWDDDLAASLAAHLPPGSAPAKELAAQFASRVTASYRQMTSPDEARRDVEELAVLQAAGAPSDEADGVRSVFGGGHRLVVRPSNDPACSFRLRRYGEHAIELTRFLPALESFGLVVVESIPFHLGAGGEGAPAVHIDDIGVRTEAPHGPETLRFVPEIHGPRLVEAIEALDHGQSDIDSLNRLVTVAGFDWRQVMILRAYLRYWLQDGTAFSWAALSDPLADFPDVARALVGYFQTRFDPEQQAGGPVQSKARGAAERSLCLAQLDLVPHLEQDTVLRGYLGLIEATVRTNYFQHDEAGAFRPALIMKFDSVRVPELPPPRPKVEAFVHSPRVEGIHLRAGLVARGGLRWSERPTDFRTEVLDLAFAQVKKNAIIVPTGAKGGFVCRGAGTPGPAEISRAYEEFVTALLEVTDNIVGGQVVHPVGVVAVDGPDPYLVVAADKGTATFSDLANAISERMRFWLGDAFASGGSRGYDHKAMGITARGAWVAVRRHFRELGVDVQSDPIRVVGVGDMSGDVFGNGMLQSQAIDLVAAFDHRHIFLDPSPRADRAFAERARLAAASRSSWDDYRREAISPGGGVWSRDAKSIPISPQMRAVLGEEAEELSPPALISAILSANVDLIWFGGIGTYIKAPEEPDTEVGDHANDAVRITSDAVRARVIAEGANLGVTQRARIRYSRRGGRINADFIDNAAGVATSDREVNLKILLALAIEEGRIGPDERDDYLKRSEEEVATEVLRQVDHSVAALNRAAAVGGSARELDAYAALIDRLEGSGRFDRAVEVLPSEEEIDVRRAAGAGLIRPELAVLLAYTKSDLVAAMEQSPVALDEGFLDSVVPYFPTAIRDPFGDLIARHRLYPQLVATDVAGELVDQMGIVWAHETAAELDREPHEVAIAFWAARQITAAGVLWADLEGRTESLSAEAESTLHSIVSRAVATVARSYLAAAGPLRLSELTDRDTDLARALAAVPELTAKADVEALSRLGVDPALAAEFLTAEARAKVGDAGPVCRSTGRSVGEVMEAFLRLDEIAGLDRLGADVRTALEGPEPTERLRVWQARALLDDLASWRRAAVLDALGPAGPGAGTAGAAVTGWAEAHSSELSAATRLLVAPRHETSDLLARAALVLRRLGGVLGAGGPT